MDVEISVKDVERDASGRVPVDGPAPWTLWAAGEVAGVPRAEATRDGEALARALCDDEGADR